MVQPAPSSSPTNDSQRAAFLSAVHEGLGRRPKAISSKWLYDERGSELFECITRTPEYYPTRTEIRLLQSNRNAIARFAGPGAALVEFGSGSSRKTRLVLEAMHRPAAYVPVDISRDYLLSAASDIAEDFPEVAVWPLVADFTGTMHLPAELPSSADRVGFFPGSTIGNFKPAGAVTFLERAGETLGSGGRLIVGLDLEKPRDVLLRAYDDAEGITAAFNLNLLRRINNELDGGFDLAAFRHEVRVETGPFRVEMHLASVPEQTVAIGDRVFGFKAGETIHTEDSHKYTLDGFAALARRAGWRIAEEWRDPNGLFAIVGLCR